MSITTTHIVTRGFAIDAIKKCKERSSAEKNRIKKLQEEYCGGKLKHATDSKLEDLLEAAIHNGFYNFNIVSNWDFNLNLSKKYQSPYLDDLDCLPSYNDAN